MSIKSFTSENVKWLNDDDVIYTCGIHSFLYDAFFLLPKEGETVTHAHKKALFLSHPGFVELFLPFDSFHFVSSRYAFKAQLYVQFTFDVITCIFFFLFLSLSPLYSHQCRFYIWLGFVNLNHI